MRGRAIGAALLGSLLLGGSEARADHVVVTECAPPLCTTKGSRTFIRAPGDTLTIRGALAPEPGTRGLKIEALVIVIDGPGGGSLSSAGTGRAIELKADGMILVRGSVVSSSSRGRVSLKASDLIQVRGPGEILAEGLVDVRCSAKPCQVSLLGTMIRGRRIAVRSNGDLFTENVTFDAFGAGNSLKVRARGAVRETGAPRLDVSDKGVSADAAGGLAPKFDAAAGLCVTCQATPTLPIVFTPTPGATSSLPGDVATSTPTSSSVSTPTGLTPTPTRTPTSSAVTPTAGATATATPTAIVTLQTSTPTPPEATPTATVRLATPTATDSGVATATRAATPTLSGTATPTAPSATPTPLPLVSLHHFMCYELGRPPAPPALVDFPLADQFGPSLVETGRRWRICNPTSKNGEDPGAPLSDEHYVAYLIDQTAPNVQGIDDVTVVNQLGSITIELPKPKAMLVPSAKELAGGVPPAPLVNPTLDHMKCWNVKGAQTRGTVTSRDQFGELLVDIKQPAHLCAPATADGIPVADPDTHFMCYEVKTEPPNLLAGSHLLLANQLEQVQVELTGPREICVPSLKFH